MGAVTLGADVSALVGIGLPSYNGSAHAEEAVASLRAQTYTDFVLACTDDASTDATPDILARHAAEDPRIGVRTSGVRRGLVRNWVASYELAREMSPGMRYFAWASDHDLWDPRWLERLVAELEAHPEAVLAYPLDIGIGNDGEQVRDSWRFDTAGVRALRPRFEQATLGMSAGNMVYGLCRADALERCGVFRAVIVPDRLLLAQLAMLGEFRQVDEVLWRRRYGPRTMSIRDRQRVTFFPDGVPFHAKVPWPVVHGAVLAWTVGVRGGTRPDVPRRRAWPLILWYTAEMSRDLGRRYWTRRFRSWKRRARDLVGRSSPAG